MNLYHNNSTLKLKMSCKFKKIWFTGFVSEFYHGHLKVDVERLVSIDFKEDREVLLGPLLPSSTRTYSVSCRFETVRL